MKLKEWFDGLGINTPPASASDWMEEEGRAFSDDDVADYFVSPLIIVGDNDCACWVLSEDEEQDVREWIDVNNDRPHDLSKPTEFTFAIGATA